MINKNLFIAALSFGIAFASEAYPPQNYAVNGQYVSFSGSKIWVEKYGSGNPAIILLNGAGDTIREWNAVIPELAQTSTVVGIDYPGLGQSTAPHDLTEPMTAKQIATNLRASLKALNIPPPYILVGHSIGGLYLSYFARNYPTEVTGIVTVDGNTVSQVFMNQLNTTDLPPDAKTEIQGFIQAGNARNQKLQSQVATLMKQTPLTLQNEQTVAYNEEVLGKTESAQETLDSGPLPHIPLIALSEGASDTLDDQIWHASIKQFADQVPCSVFKVVPATGHYIQIDQPQYVITAVQAVVSAIKNKKTLCTMQIHWPPQT